MQYGNMSDPAFSSTSVLILSVYMSSVEYLVENSAVVEDAGCAGKAMGLALISSSLSHASGVGGQAALSSSRGEWICSLHFHHPTTPCLSGRCRYFAQKHRCDPRARSGVMLRPSCSASRGALFLVIPFDLGNALSCAGGRACHLVPCGSIALVSPVFSTAWFSCPAFSCTFVTLVIMSARIGSRLALA